MLRAVSEILSDIFFPLFIATEGVLRKCGAHRTECARYPTSNSMQN